MHVSLIDDKSEDSTTDETIYLVCSEGVTDEIAAAVSRLGNIEATASVGRLVIKQMDYLQLMSRAHQEGRWINNYLDTWLQQAQQEVGAKTIAEEQRREEMLNSVARAFGVPRASKKDQPLPKTYT